MKSHMELLRELREDRDLTQAQVAQVLGTTQQVYSRYEQGINELPGAASADPLPLLPG